MEGPDQPGLLRHGILKFARLVCIPPGPRKHAVQTGGLREHRANLRHALDGATDPVASPRTRTKSAIFGVTKVILQIDRRPIQSALHIAGKTRQTAPRTDQSHTAAIVPCVAKFAGTFAAAQFVCRQSKLFFCLLVHVVPFRCEAKTRVPHSASAGEDLPSGVFLRSHERPSFTNK
jgi:hypothetical protein